MTIEDQKELANVGAEPTQRDAHENAVAMRVIRSAFEKLGSMPSEEVLSTFITCMQSAIHDLNHPILVLEPGKNHILFLRIDRQMDKEDRIRAFIAVKGMMPNNRVILIPEQYDVMVKMTEVITMLNNMVLGREKHTEESKAIVETALAFLQA